MLRPSRGTSWSGRVRGVVFTFPPLDGLSFVPSSTRSVSVFRFATVAPVGRAADVTASTTSAVTLLPEARLL